jgi:hypothetical protein
VQCSEAFAESAAGTASGEASGHGCLQNTPLLVIDGVGHVRMDWRCSLQAADHAHHVPLS